MRSLSFLPVLLLVSACAADPGQGAVTAQVQDAPAAAPPVAPAAPAAGAVTLAVNPAASTLRALGAKVTAQHPIDFKTWSGTVSLAGDKLESLTFEVDMATLESDHPKLTEHLKSPDFFDIATFPKSTFTSASITEGSTEAGFTHTVAGDMTIRGTTKRLTFPARVMVEPAQVKAETEFVITREDFGVVYPGRPDDLIQSNVKMTVSFVAPRS
jgi:polyisoprenoid-binding protein YceI